MGKVALPRKKSGIRSRGASAVMILTTFENLVGPRFRPGRPSRQVNGAAPLPFMQHGCNHQIRAEHELILYAETTLILRKIEKQRPHRRMAFFVSQPHLRSDIWPQTLPQKQQPTEDGICLVTIRPYFVWASAWDRIADRRFAPAVRTE